jgi:hypothetical protein
MDGLRSTALCFVLVASGLSIVTPGCSSDDTAHARGGSEGGEGGEQSSSTNGGKAAGGSSNGATGNTEVAGAGADLGGAAGDDEPSSNQAGMAAGGTTEVGGAGAAGFTADAGAGGAAGEPCSGPPRCVSETLAAVCPPSGLLQTLECTNGCTAGVCAPTDLSTGWVLHQYSLSNDLAVNANYTFTQNGLSALQAENAMPSIYYLDRDLANVEISGSFAVETTGDDDMIGFVFGMQDTEHYYLFDWKQLAQNDGTCGNAAMGAELKLISGDVALTDCTTFWQSTASTSTQVVVPASENPTGWLDNTVYSFSLRHRPGSISITVKNGADTVVSMSSNDATYTHGRFGFYNYSQASSRYELFQFQPAE